MPRGLRPALIDGHVTSFQVHFLYQYSLQFFLDIYHNVLYENPNLKGATDHTQRLSVITKDLFQVESRACCVWCEGTEVLSPEHQRVPPWSPGGI